jgi:hypothetical protein
VIQVEIVRRQKNKPAIADYDVYLYMPESPDGGRIIQHHTVVEHFERTRGASELLREAVEALGRKL